MDNTHKHLASNCTDIAGKTREYFKVCKEYRLDGYSYQDCFNFVFLACDHPDELRTQIATLIMDSVYILLDATILATVSGQHQYRAVLVKDDSFVI